jgi:AcrR family transcriptional regulator
VRDVLAEAGVANASAVGYYFGSKDGLVAAVERRAVEQVNAERAAGLAALPRDAALDDLVRAWVAPLVRLRCAGRGPATARVFMRIFDEPQEQWTSNGAHEVMEVGWRFLAASAPHLPGIDRHGLLWRWQSVTAVMAFYCHGYLEPFGAEPARATSTGTCHGWSRRGPPCCALEADRWPPTCDGARVSSRGRVHDLGTPVAGVAVGRRLLAVLAAVAAVALGGHPVQRGVVPVLAGGVATTRGAAERGHELGPVGGRPVPVPSAAEPVDRGLPAVVSRSGIDGAGPLLVPVGLGVALLRCAVPLLGLRVPVVGERQQALDVDVALGADLVPQVGDRVPAGGDAAAAVGPAVALVRGVVPLVQAVLGLVHRCLPFAVQASGRLSATLAHRRRRPRTLDPCHAGLPRPTLGADVEITAPDRWTGPGWASQSVWPPSRSPLSRLPHERRGAWCARRAPRVACPVS